MRNLAMVGGLGIPVLVLALASPALSLEARAIKSACDRSGNWLIDQHNLADGTFGKSKSAKMPGVVAMVLQALCDHPRAYRESDGPYMTRPVKYLLDCQQENGAIALKEFGRDTYHTALAILALKSLENKAHKDAIARARAYLLKCQAKDGGFTYGEGFRHGGDLSNTWFALLGLQAGGGKVEAGVQASTLDFIRRCQDQAETNPEFSLRKGENTGGFYYKPGESEAGTFKTRDGNTAPKPYGSMSAAGAESLLLCGLQPSAAEVQGALRWFKQNFVLKENPGAGMQGYFYYAWAFARAMRATGAKEIDLADGKKAKWAEELAAQLMALQEKDGSFVNREPRWMEDDPVLCTSYALEALNLCWANLK